MKRHDLCKCDAVLCVHRMIRLQSTRVMVTVRWSLRRHGWRRLNYLQHLFGERVPYVDVVDVVDVAIARGYGIALVRDVDTPQGRRRWALCWKVPRGAVMQ